MKFYWNIGFAYNNKLISIKMVVDPLFGSEEGSYTEEECNALAVVFASEPRPDFSDDVFEAHKQLTEFSELIRKKALNKNTL